MNRLPFLIPQFREFYCGGGGRGEMRGKDPHRRHSPPAAILAGILAPLMLEAVWAHEEAPLVRHLGCFRDADMGGGERVVRSIEHQTEHVQGMYKSRPAAVEACAVWNARTCPGSAPIRQQ